MIKALLFALMTLLCPALLHAGNTAPTRLYVVVDTATPMAGGYQWLTDTLLTIKSETSSQPLVLPSFGLHSFDRKVSRTVSSDKQSFKQALNALTVTPAPVNGLPAIQRIIDDIEHGAHILLITRDSSPRPKKINFAALAKKFIKKNITMHLLTDIDFECEEHWIFGVNQHLEGINEKFEYSGCNILTPLHVDRNDYVKLALASGGHLWRLEAIKANNIAYGKYLGAEMLDIYGASKP
ncbi:MAG: hypothetical protein COA42_11265 [Alteromonadaceae bacterium]|nr:MAG: hypothetical protein COA42_11265 [Alteromonadaceae bacterium]